MALSKDKKNQVVSELKQLLEDSKLVVVAKYSGLNVKDMQNLRAEAGNQDVAVRVAKNRLVKIAAKDIKRFADTNLEQLQGQLMYAISAVDEIAPAQVLATFAKQHPQLEIWGGIDADGNYLESTQVNTLAQLPGKDMLRAQLIGVLSAPMGGMINVLAGNIRGLMNVLNARSQQLEAK